MSTGRYGKGFDAGIPPHLSLSTYADDEDGISEIGSEYPSALALHLPYGPRISGVSERM